MSDQFQDEFKPNYIFKRTRLKIFWQFHHVHIREYGFKADLKTGTIIALQYNSWQSGADLCFFEAVTN